MERGAFSHRRNLIYFFIFFFYMVYRDFGLLNLVVYFCDFSGIVTREKKQKYNKKRSFLRLDRARYLLFLLSKQGRKAGQPGPLGRRPSPRLC